MVNSMKKALDLAVSPIMPTLFQATREAPLNQAVSTWATPANTRGMKEAEMAKIADLMLTVARLCAEAGSLKALEANYQAELSKIHSEVKALALSFSSSDI